MPVTIDGSNTPTAGGIGYGDGTELAFTNAGTSGQVLVSNGAGAPTFGAAGVAGGGTGQTSLTANNVLLGNGTSAVQFVAPGSNGNVLTSNGTTWTSAAPAGGGSWVYLSTVTASNAATADVETTFDSTYDAYAIIGTNIYSQNDGVLLYCRLKIGGTYQTASSYSYADYGVSTNSTSMRVYTSTGAAFIQVNSSSGGDGGLNSESTTPGMLTLYTQNPSNASTYKLVTGTYAYVPEDGGAKYTQTEFGGRYHGAAGALTGIRFYASAGNITGTFRLYGIKNS